MSYTILQGVLMTKEQRDERRAILIDSLWDRRSTIDPRLQELVERLIDNERSRNAKKFLESDEGKILMDDLRRTIIEMENNATRSDAMIKRWKKHLLDIQNN